MDTGYTTDRPEGKPADTGRQKIPQGNAPGDITLTPSYISAVNEITQPSKYAVCSQYLIHRWMRDLGPTGFAVLMCLRARCYNNPKTGERREDTQLTIREIAEECGVSDRTVRREFENNWALKRFVRPQREYVPDGGRGGYRTGPNSFHVAMDDPIHPDDEPRLQEVIRRKAAESDKGAEPPLDRARRRAARQSTPGQNDPGACGQNDRAQGDGTLRSVKMTGGCDNLTGGSDKSSGEDCQIDRTLKNYSEDYLDHSLLPQTDAGAGSGVVVGDDDEFEEEHRKEDQPAIAPTLRLTEQPAPPVAPAAPERPPVAAPAAPPEQPSAAARKAADAALLDALVELPVAELGIPEHEARVMLRGLTLGGPALGGTTLEEVRAVMGAAVGAVLIVQEEGKIKTTACRLLASTLERKIAAARKEAASVVSAPPAPPIPVDVSKMSTPALDRARGNPWAQQDAIDAFDGLAANVQAYWLGRGRARFRGSKTDNAVTIGFAREAWWTAGCSTELPQDKQAEARHEVAI